MFFKSLIFSLFLGMSIAQAQQQDNPVNVDGGAGVGHIVTVSDSSSTSSTRIQCKRSGRFLGNSPAIDDGTIDSPVAIDYIALKDGKTSTDLVKIAGLEGKSTTVRVLYHVLDNFNDGLAVMIIEHDNSGEHARWAHGSANDQVVYEEVTWANGFNVKGSSSRVLCEIKK